MPPGRGRGPGPGRGRRGRGRGRRGHGGEGGGGDKPEEPAPAAKEESTPAASSGTVCEYPRCTEPPSYGFPDSAVAQFCEEHKDNDDMVLKVANPDEPKEASLALVREYKELEPKLKELKDAPRKMQAAKDEINKLSSAIVHQNSDLDKLTKGVQALDVKVEKEEAKPQRRIRGPLAQDPKKIKQWNKEKETSLAQAGEIKGKKEMCETKLKMLKDELPGLAKPAKEHSEIHAKMMSLKAKAVDGEPSYLYLAFKASGDEEKKKEESEVIFQRLLEKVE